MSLVNWLGGEISASVAEATRRAIDETTAAAAEQAAGTSFDLFPHEAAGYFWFDVTPRVEEGVASEPAQVRGTHISGRFGTTGQRGGYGLFLERAQPFLRPAADGEFPQLADRIKANLS